MRAGFLLLAISPLAGCSLARNAAHNLANETAEYHDQKKLSRQLRADARAAWAAYCARTGGASADFADGFQDGYADYLESGGNGSPPAVPPLRYRRSGYLNPEGHARIRDYFAGFKAGTDCAAASGQRHYLTVPVLVSDAAHPAPLPGVQIPAAPAVPISNTVAPSPAPLRVGEQLPTPRPLDGLPIPERPKVEPLPNPLPLPIPKAQPPAEKKAEVKPPAPDPLQPTIPIPPQSRADPKSTIVPASFESGLRPTGEYIRSGPLPPEPPRRTRIDRGG